MKRYSHAFDFGFDVETNEKPENVPGAVLKAGLLRRIRSMPDIEFQEACSYVDTYVNTAEDDEGPIERPDYYR